MSIWDVFLIGIGLSMDAVCVSLANGIAAKKLNARDLLLPSAFFGLFQGIMPIIGYFAGSLFVSFFSKYSYILVFCIFLILGVKMILDSLKDDENYEQSAKFTVKVIFIQAVATSIDALAVGVSLSAMNTEIFSSALIIAITTFVLSIIAVLTGKKIGKVFYKIAGYLGGGILILMAVKVLIEGVLK